MSGYVSRTVRTRGIPIVTQDKAVDNYITEKDLAVVYDRWGEGVNKYKWEEPLAFQGGVKSITVDMIKRTPVKELEKLFYKTRTKRILEAIKNIS